jgi:transposase
MGDPVVTDPVVTSSGRKRSDPISQWAAALKDRAGWQKAVVALANKNARILWAVMTKGDAFDARHVSVKPKAAAPTATTPAPTTPASATA